MLCSNGALPLLEQGCFLSLSQYPVLPVARKCSRCTDTSAAIPQGLVAFARMTPNGDSPYCDNLFRVRKSPLISYLALPVPAMPTFTRWQWLAKMR